ncbi:MAG TPA: PLP-dependent aminotransferase family protein [Gaiellaceae bacterium]|nr:PLP-dependent aminotransferase family protein [Gaiellaceae bacterium]
MAVEPTVRSWEELFAERTRGGAGDGLLQILAFASVKDVVSFAGGFPDPETFPGAIVADILRELAERGDATPFQYAPTDGLPGPRDYVAGRLERMNGARPAEGELMLTSGAIEALELVGKSLLDRGDRVLVEAPTYLGAIMAFQSFEARVEGVPLDADGLAVDELERMLAAGPPPKLLYTIPDFQNPAGVTLSSDRREALVELARRHGFLVVEDVAYRELGFEGEQPPTLHGLAPDVVLQAGTFSKTFFPGVRLGWAAGPVELVSKLVWAKQNTDQCAGALGQRLLEEYGRRGHLDERIAQARGLYRRRRDAIMDALERHVGDRAAWTRPAGGFFTWLELGAGADGAEVARRALEAGVAVVPGKPFFPDAGGETSVRLSYSRVTEDEIERGIAALARALR